jgi:hypothetical protein
LNWSIAITYNASDTSNNPIFYKNGIKYLTSEYSTPSGTRNDDSAYDLYVGADGSGHFSECQIDDIRLYNDILTDTEILCLYDKTKIYY